MSDPSNGYEAVAAQFISGPGRRTLIGAQTVGEWATRLRAGSSVLDLGCGSGYPITQQLVDAGLTVFGVDASPTMVAAFRARFPDVEVECNSVKDSTFFRREFDGVIAWGLLFLLSRESQVELIRKVAKILKPGGEFLFTAPSQECEWSDVMTDRLSRSLGAATYRRLMKEEGLLLVSETDDEGGNHYYLARRE